MPEAEIRTYNPSFPDPHGLGEKPTDGHLISVGGEKLVPMPGPEHVRWLWLDRKCVVLLNRPLGCPVTIVSSALQAVSGTNNYLFFLLGHSLKTKGQSPRFRNRKTEAPLSNASSGHAPVCQKKRRHWRQLFHTLQVILTIGIQHSFLAHHP